MTNLLLPLLVCSTLLGAADPQEAVQSGQKALDHWGRYPWYDAKSDDLEPLDLSPPWWANWWPNSQGPSWSLSLPSSLLQWVAWIVIALALGVMILLLVRTFLARRKSPTGEVAGSGRSSAADDRRRVEALPLPGVGGQLDLLAEAERQYHLGHYGQAIIYLFSYQLVQLDRQQLIHLSKGKTNRQYLRELGPHKPLRRLLEPSMLAFEDVFFGQHTLDRGRFEWCWARLGEFQSLAAEGRP
jgi:hypothetical protein